MCPGNHDVNLAAVKERKMPGSTDEVDKSIDFPLPDNLVKPFENFIQFCDAIKGFYRQSECPSSTLE
jgi:hypothetical protein